MRQPDGDWSCKDANGAQLEGPIQIQIHCAYNGHQQTVSETAGRVLTNILTVHVHGRERDGMQSSDDRNKERDTDARVSDHGMFAGEDTGDDENIVPTMQGSAKHI